MPPLLELQHVSKVYRTRHRLVNALSEITLSVPTGTTVAIAGESGSGKSTLGRLMLAMEPLSTGAIFFKGKNLDSLQKKEKWQLRRKMQMVFQDPFSSLNPRMTVNQIIAEGIEIHALCSGQQKEEKVATLLTQMGLDPSYANRYPHELSGGQRQRVGIARAFAVDPEFIVLDEPLSALDYCTHKQITDLLLRLKEERKLTYLFISHDLKAIRAIADHVVILHRGQIVESAPTAELFRTPVHGYTQKLLASIM